MMELIMQETNTITYAKEVKDKTEKIVAGLHVLTNHLPDNNLLKSEIRNTAVSLLSSVLEDKESGHYINNLSSFIRVATLAQDISKENATIIVTELGKVQGTKDMNGIHNMFKDKYETTDNVLHLTALRVGTITQEHVPLSPYALPKEPPSTIKETFSEQNSSNTRQETTENMSYNYHPTSMKKDTTVNIKDMLKNASPRRLKVVSLLSHADAKNIKDVSRHFNDVSEKTIQRELNDMVDAKIIIRIGDRRWSTYKLR